MDRAINKNTEEIISAFEVYENGSYQNLTKGEWIAPKDSIHNWEEISEEDSYVHYRKETLVKYKSGKQGLRSPHFAVYPNSKAKTVLESPIHKMLKDWLFNKLYKDDLEIIYSKPTKKYKYDNSNKISELNIDWKNYSIEVPIRSIKNLKADILLPFKNKHPILGFGIIIEIQLSKQDLVITYDRTIDRAINGYSTIWLFKKDFNIEEDNIELKNNKLKVYSFTSELKYSGKKFINKLQLEVEEQCRFLDIKKEELIKKTDEINKYKDKFINEIKETINGFFSYKIEELSENFNEEVVNRIQEDFFEKNQHKIKEMIQTTIPFFLKEEFLQLIKEQFYQNVLSKFDYQQFIEKLKNELFEKVEDKFNTTILYKEIIKRKCPKCDNILNTFPTHKGSYVQRCRYCEKWIPLPIHEQEILKKLGVSSIKW